MDANTVLEGLGNNFLGKNGDVDSSFLKTNKFVGLYFSAHWCPPCRGFTPQLVQFYNEVNKTEKNLEIVFVTCDQSQEQFNGYFSEMPWLAVPFGDQRCDLLSDMFECKSIPYLVILRPDGSVVTKNARNEVGQSGIECFNTWLK